MFLSNIDTSRAVLHSHLYFGSPSNRRAKQRERSTCLNVLFPSEKVVVTGVLGVIKQIGVKMGWQAVCMLREMGLLKY